MLLGEYNYNVDAKGRVFVPAKLKDSLGEVFVLAKGMDPCIAIYSLEMWNAYVAKLSALPEMKARNIRRFLFSSAQEASCDSQGRVVLTSQLREYADLVKEVTIIGAGDHAEIWNAEGYKAHMSSETVEDMEKILMEFGF